MKTSESLKLRKGKKRMCTEYKKIRIHIHSALSFSTAMQEADTELDEQTNCREDEITEDTEPADPHPAPLLPATGQPTRLAATRLSATRCKESKGIRQTAEKLISPG